MRESNGPKASDLYLTKSRISRFYVNVAFWSTAGTEFGKTGDADSAIVRSVGARKYSVECLWFLAPNRLETISGPS